MIFSWQVATYSDAHVTYAHGNSKLTDYRLKAGRFIWCWLKAQLRFGGYFEFLVFFLNFLGTDIFHYHLIRYIPRTCCKEAARPNMSPPTLLTYMVKFHQKLSGTFTFDLLHENTRWYVRWHWHKQVHMVLAYVPLQYLHLIFRTYLPRDLSYPYCYFSC